jgi:glucose-1-phosphate thymidylyltransferase
MKGIILTGGHGSRLYPSTLATNKQLLPVFDKPMIYYPLTTLMENGVIDICIITNPESTSNFKKLLGNGNQWGVKITYKVQEKPNGIPEAFLIARGFLNNDDGVALILGDNIYYGANDILSEAFYSFSSGGTIFGYRVEDPERYGVVELDGNNVLSIEEKPKKPKSSFAVPGLYLFDYNVVKIAEKLKPSKRGELEITDVIKAYLREDTLNVFKLPRGTVWLDAGTSSSLFDSSAYVQAIEKRQGVKIGCPEETAYKQGNINKTQLRKLIKNIPNCEYKLYLSNILKYE